MRSSRRTKRRAASSPRPPIVGLDEVGSVQPAAAFRRPDRRDALVELSASAASPPAPSAGSRNPTTPPPNSSTQAPVSAATQKRGILAF